MTNADRARRCYKEVWVKGVETTVDELMAEKLEGWDSWNLGALLQSLPPVSPEVETAAR